MKVAISSIAWCIADCHLNGKLWVGLLFHHVCIVAIPDNASLFLDHFLRKLSVTATVVQHLCFICTGADDHLISIKALTWTSHNMHC